MNTSQSTKITHNILIDSLIKTTKSNQRTLNGRLYSNDRQLMPTTT